MFSIYSAQKVTAPDGEATVSPMEISRSKKQSKVSGQSMPNDKATDGSILQLLSTLASNVAKNSEMIAKLDDIPGTMSTIVTKMTSFSERLDQIEQIESQSDSEIESPGNHVDSLIEQLDAVNTGMLLQNFLIQFKKYIVN